MIGPGAILTLFRRRNPSGFRPLRPSFGARLLRFPWSLCLCCLLQVNAPAADWPMFRGGPALLGVASGSLPSKLHLLWTFKSAGPVKSSAAIQSGRIFIGSQDGNVYSLRFADGKKIWAFKTGGPVESSPLALESMVFVGSSDAEIGRASCRERV